MRHSVTTLGYRFRKALDDALYTLSRTLAAAPARPLAADAAFDPHAAARGWLPLYTMVTFRPDIAYADARRKHAAQTRVLERAAWLSAAAAVVGAGAAAAVLVRRLYGAGGRH